MIDKKIQRDVIKFHSEAAGNAKLTFYLCNGDESCVGEESIQFRVGFTANGYEWQGYRTYTDVLYYNELEDDETWVKFFDKLYTSHINFHVCLDDSGRKRPPTSKQNQIEDDFYEELYTESRAPRQTVINQIKIFISDARLLMGSGNPYEQELENMRNKVAQMEEREKRSDIMNIITENVAAAVTPMIEDAIRNRVGSLAGSVPQELIVKIGDTINHCGEAVRHHKFQQVLAAIMVGESCWLKGDAGTGKSYMCEQIAEALGAKYFCTGSIMDEYAGLKGFIDANGIKHGTEFTHALDAMEQGQEVLMVFDEADGSTPEIMLAINNFLSGGVIECMGHAYRMADNMHIVACGNTNGRGGDTKYTRSIIDEATLDRFVFIDIDYDKYIELNVAGGDEQLATFCRELREAAARCGIQLLVTYRAIARMLRLQEVWDSRRDVLLASVIRGMDASDIGVVYRDMQNHHCPDSAWFDELQRMAA